MDHPRKNEHTPNRKAIIARILILGFVILSLAAFFLVFRRGHMNYTSRMDFIAQRLDDYPRMHENYTRETDEMQELWLTSNYQSLAEQAVVLYRWSDAPDAEKLDSIARTLGVARVRVISADDEEAVAQDIEGRNLDAAFAGGGAVMAGEGLAYAPAEFAPEQFTAYLTHQGTPPWYAGPGDLSHLPTGRQKLGDVVYHIADFKTSPVPGAAMLRGHGAGARAEKVTGIKIGRRADALFFLHACNPDPKELARLDRDKPALWRYVVHYADGKTAEVPVRWGEDVGAWDVAAARPLKNAVVAWQGAFPKDGSRRAALYTFQWNNPRPQAAIESVDFVEGPDHGRLASPALLAITAGSAAKINF